MTFVSDAYGVKVAVRYEVTAPQEITLVEVTSNEYGNVLDNLDYPEIERLQNEALMHEDWCDSQNLAAMICC